MDQPGNECPHFRNFLRCNSRVSVFLPPIILRTSIPPRAKGGSENGEKVGNLEGVAVSLSRLTGGAVLERERETENTWRVKLVPGLDCTWLCVSLVIKLCREEKCEEEECLSIRNDVVLVSLVGHMWDLRLSLEYRRRVHEIPETTKSFLCLSSREMEIKGHRNWIPFKTSDFKEEKVLFMLLQ
ncbi:hypothetical protein TIFTF001_014793 [Ficus carica]|uniref:Uncharacterized protein n=1 Tax=Ficus carica TaxID=3494 RepID=A0AA88AGP4_FICCA|nr:hypothetical protein TIFTF001_014793 [Ficus carica]